jgi:hypothetical protein
MACGIYYLRWLSEQGYLPRKGRLLDIGESCLLGATAEDIRFMLERHGARLEPGRASRLAETYARRSQIPRDPHVESLFLAELMEQTEVEYVAFDVVSVYKAQLFDLNVHCLAADKRNSFDIAFNFGTTEHLFNQFNAFRVIHEAVRPGGYMFHQLPATGYANHGYFNYNPLMFRELGAANDYELVALWYWGQNPGGTTIAVNPAAYPFPDGGTAWRQPAVNSDGSWNVAVPDSLVNVLFRKKHDAPFHVGLEVATAAGAISPWSAYQSDYIDHSADGTRPDPNASVVLRVPPLLQRLALRARRVPGVRPLARGVWAIPGIGPMARRLMRRAVRSSCWL